MNFKTKEEYSKIGLARRQRVFWQRTVEVQRDRFRRIREMLGSVDCPSTEIYLSSVALFFRNPEEEYWVLKTMCDKALE